MSEEDLWSEMGKVPNYRVVPLRCLCRHRLEGIDPFLVTANLKRTADDARDTAETIRMLGGQPKAAERAEKIADVFEWWLDNPEGVRELIQKEYSVEYEQSPSGNPSTPSPDGEDCPYENNPEKRSCWGCHVPRKIWQVMERKYDEEQANE